MSLFESKKNISIYLIILLLPFSIFYWMIPFIADVTISGDYLAFPVKQQMELLFSIKSGSFPLYVPGFAGGHSSSALTLGQMYHPLPHLASIMPGYWEGKAIEWNNLFKLLSLGVAHMALYLFLRKMGLHAFFAFLLSVITVYNLRIIDLYRYGATLEAYTAFLVLCGAIGWYFTKPAQWFTPLCMIGATYMLVCSGHPQMMYFGFLGVFMFTCVVPFFLSTMVNAGKVESRTVLKGWSVVGLCVFLGITLSSVYISPFYHDFIQINSARVGQDYAWADSNLDSFIGTLDNFFLPLHSDAFSAFGGSSLILMAAVLPVIRVFKVRIPRSIWALWGFLLFMFLFMQGGRTPVHKLVWEYLPLASSTRVAGRISMIMPVFIMMLLAWVVKAEDCKLRIRRFSVMSRPSKLLAYIGLLFMVVYYFLYLAGYRIFSFTEFHEYFTYPIGAFFDIPYVWVTSMIVILGIISIIAFANYGKRKGLDRVFSIILIIATFMQLGIALKYRAGQWIEKKYDSPTFEEMREQKKNRLEYTYYPGGGLHSSIVITQINRSFLEPFLGKIFTQIIPVKSLDESYGRMRSERLPQQVFMEGYTAEKALSITHGAKNMKKGTVKLIFSSFNRLEFQVHSQARAFFGLSYPYSGHWEARVNGKDVQVYRVNGAAHAVEIPAGESAIEFRYWSNAAFWGIVISSATFALIGLLVCIRALGGLPRIVAMGFMLLLSFGGFILWYHSLYNGDNLGTEYSWTYTPPLKRHNLAYGKKNWISPSAIPMRWEHTRKEAKVSKLVDGDGSPGSGFSSSLSDNPAWFLDLHDTKNIKAILLYESNQDSLVNVRPLSIALSDDGNKWIPVASFVSPATREEPARIVFDRPQTARYVRIMASGKSILSFDEVEVYEPEDHE